jgi:hypothetical protein
MKSDNLKEVIIANDNPALAIIKRQLPKGTNNPTASIKSFDFTS